MSGEAERARSFPNCPSCATRTSMPWVPKMALMSRQLVWSSPMMRRVLGMGVKLWCSYHGHGAQTPISGQSGSGSP
jgi:hypothetical protein